MSEDVWILGYQHDEVRQAPDKDVIDLAAEAATAALVDGGVTMKDIEILAYGNLLGRTIGQHLLQQIGQFGIPVYNVSNACATGATALRQTVMAIKAGEADLGLAVGVEKLAGAGLLAGGDRSRGRRHVECHRAGSAPWPPWTAAFGTETMPGVFAQIGMEYGDNGAAVPALSSSPKSAKRSTRTRRSTRFATYTKRMSHRGNHE